MSRSGKILFIVITLLVILIFLGFVLRNGYIWLDNPDEKKYPIKGFDISSHQGEINWSKVDEYGAVFIYIKATEGKDYIDSHFKKNYESAKKIGLKVGAYHFFTFKSNGKDQAKNFIKTVPKEKGNLPPVIDIEFSGNSKVIPKKEVLNKELKDFIFEVKNYYKQDPILYVTYDSFNQFLQGNFDNDIWIRDIIKQPKLSEGREWTFWQYCDRGRISGIKGPVDLDVFFSNKDDLKKYFSEGKN